MASLISSEAVEVNKAYRTFRDVSLIDRVDGKRQKLITTQPGDTLYVTEEAESYIENNNSGPLKYLPVEYKGVRGYAQLSDMYPVKISETDPLVYMQRKQLEDRVAQERFLVPAMEWAMNAGPGHMTWIWLVFISLGCAVVFACMATSPRLFYLGLILAGLSLAVTTVAEIMYMLCFHDYVLWFLYPSVVGGWGHVILNYILFSIAMAAQVGVFYFVWKQSFNSKVEEEKAEKKNDDDDDDDDDEGTPSWLTKLAFWPVAAGIVLMFVTWIDFAADSSFTPMPYLAVFGSLAVCALCGLGYQFYRKRWWQAVVFPVLYVAGGIGITCVVMIQGMLVVVVAVGAVIFGLIAGAALGAVVGAFGMIGGAGRRVGGYTDDGKKVTGTQDAFGNVRGDDGKTYKMK